MKKIVVLTGAGVSAESGLSTYRDSGGTWDNYDPMVVASIQGWYNDPETVLTYNYGDWAAWPGRLKPHHPASSFDMEKALALRRFLKRHGQGGT